MAVTDIIVVEGRSDREARNKCPRGYTLIPVDLNMGAGGRWLYLCYSTAPGLAPIEALALSFSTSSSTRWAGPAAATRIDVDLNMGAGGEYIYLWYLRQGADRSTIPFSLRSFFSNTTNVESLDVIAADNPITSHPQGAIWKRVEGYKHPSSPIVAVDPDVNRGAGGKYIYIFYIAQIALAKPG